MKSSDSRKISRLRVTEHQRTREKPERMLFSRSGALVLRVLSGCSWLKFIGIGLRAMD
jgi:hypothetical protein